MWSLCISFLNICCSNLRPKYPQVNRRVKCVFAQQDVIPRRGLALRRREMLRERVRLCWRPTQGRLTVAAVVSTKLAQSANLPHASHFHFLWASPVFPPSCSVAVLNLAAGRSFSFNCRQRRPNYHPGRGQWLALLWVRGRGSISDIFPSLHDREGEKRKIFWTKETLVKVRGERVGNKTHVFWHDSRRFDLSSFLPIRWPNFKQSLCWVIFCHLNIQEYHECHKYF